MRVQCLTCGRTGNGKPGLNKCGDVTCHILPLSYDEPKCPHPIPSGYPVLYVPTKFVHQ